ncbi:MAG: mRNA surveillance protein pelota [Candidatus Micrarchaeota archaeon]
MKIVHFNEREGEMKVIADTTDDLWHLERVLQSGDVIFSKSFRRFKSNEGDSGEKKAVNVELEAEKIEFAEHANKLRITGKILAGTPEEFVQVGSYHTIDIELGFPFKIRKRWKRYELDRIKQAQKETRKPKLGIVALDEAKATFAQLKGSGVDFKFEIANPSRKGDEKHEESMKKYLADIAKSLDELKVEKAIVAGPGFTKDSLRKYISEKKPELLKKLHFDSCSNSEESGVYELLKRGVAAKIMGEERVQKEFEWIEKLLAEIGKESGLATYGKKEVEKAVEWGAVGELAVVDELLRKDKEVERILENAERKNVKLIIFSAENDAGKQLSGFSGIAALLRYKIE